MADSFEGLDASFAQKLQQLGEVCQLNVVSGRRSNAEQTRLYNDWKAGKRNVPVVAKPGTSKHESGFAADISGDMQCIQQNAAGFGLHFPVKGEPWHVEPIGARGPENDGAEVSSGPPADPVSTAIAGFMTAVEQGPPEGFDAP